jgi:DNA-binding CsgD family transcriptional regulator
VLLAASVDIMLASGDDTAAGRAADELVEMAALLDAPMLRARAHQGRGAVLLSAGDTSGALEQFRAAWSTWQEVGAPSEGAQARASIGEVCRRLGDGDAAAMELDAARAVFEALGAAPDSARLAPPPTRSPAARPGGLTAREAEVLALVAAGRSNHEIAEALSLSDHTVRRHLQNIFPKIGVTSRVAAAAYAFTHGLV